MPDKYAENSFVYDLNLIGGKLFIKIDPGHQMIVMDPDTGTIEAEFVAYSHSPSAIASPDEKVAYYTYGSHLYEYHLETKTTNPVMIGDNPATLGQTAIGWDFVQLDDPDYPGPTLFGFIGNYEGKAFKYNLQTRALKVMTLPLPPQPTDIYNVASGPTATFPEAWGYIPRTPENSCGIREASANRSRSSRLGIRCISVFTEMQKFMNTIRRNPGKQTRTRDCFSPCKAKAKTVPTR